MTPFFGVLVPFLDLLGIRSERWESGRTSLTVEPVPALTNHFGDLHGGVLATMLDVAMASSARSMYPDAAGVVTVDMSLQFLGVGKGPLRAEGRVLKAGKSTAFCEAEVRDAAGELIARAIGTFSVRRKPG